MRRLLIWLAVILVLAGAISAAAFPMKAWYEERNKPKYLTSTVTRGRVETVVNSTGTIKPVRTVSVGAFTSGPIKEINIDFNSDIEQISENEWLVDGVRKVKWLALIDGKLQSAAVERDKAAVATQQAELKRINSLHDLAVIKWKAGDELDKKSKQYKYISRIELKELEIGVETLKAQKELAAATIRQAQANLKNAEDQLRYTEILPPKEIDREKGIKGKVIDRKVDPGQTVAASFQTPELFTIALEMDKHMHVYASVDEADIGAIRTASERKQGVNFTVDAYPGELFDGMVHDIRLNSTTTQNVVTYPVIIDAKNKDQKLKPGMTANITFQIDSKDDVLRVPVAALRFTPLKDQVHPEDRHHLEALIKPEAVSASKRTADEKAVMAKNRARRIVWVQEGKQLRAVEILTGLSDHQYAQVVQVLKGDLPEGQTIITGMESGVAPR